jgi:hypothetical protein
MMGFLLDTNILSELRKARKGSDHSLDSAGKPLPVFFGFWGDRRGGDAVQPQVRATEQLPLHFLTWGEVNGGRQR